MPTVEHLIVRALDTLPGTSLRAAILEHHLDALLEGLVLELQTQRPLRTTLILPAPCEALVSALTRLGLEVELRILSPLFMDEEDLALAQHLEGRPAMAGDRPIPSLRVVNAETLAVAGKDTRFVQLQGALVREAVLEVPEGTPLRQLIYEHCGGLRDHKAFKFVLAGGPTGCFIPESGLDAPLATSTLVVGSEAECVVDLARRCLTQSAQETCGRCVVCREGSYQLQEILADMSSGKTRPEDESQIRELAAALAAGSLCGLGRGAAAPLLSGLQHFPEEFEAHLKRKRCPALVCRKYVTFHILGETCSGCGKCLGTCPEEAIEGEEDYIHVIDPKACTQCGLCFEVCPEGAITKAGPLKPKTPKEPIPVGTWKKR